MRFSTVPAYPHQRFDCLRTVWKRIVIWFPGDQEGVLGQIEVTVEARFASTAVVGDWVKQKRNWVGGLGQRELIDLVKFLMNRQQIQLEWSRKVE